MKGYYRFPSIYKNKVVFVADDDLWIVDLKDLESKRITTNISHISSPRFSPDGKHIAYIGQEDGNTEVYIVSSNGGESKRLTYDGGFISKIASWDKNSIIYTSDLNMPFSRISDLRRVGINGGESTALNYGIASNIAISNDFTVLGRNTSDPARWKRYKGGTAGELWIDRNNGFSFKKLLNLPGNMACPMILKNRIFFISDHEGIGNIYSCLKNGQSIKQHTFHKNYYVRNASNDSSSIVYHAGADIYRFSLKRNKSEKINVVYNSGNNDKSRKFSPTINYLEDVSLSSNGEFVNIISRGKSYSMGNWSGAALQYGKMQGVRYQFPIRLTDDKKMLLCSDEGGEEHLEIFSLNDNRKIKTLKSKIGRPISIKKSPIDDTIALVNHKHELILIDLKTDKSNIIDRSSNHVMQCNWSPDGKYIAYTCSKNNRVSIIKIYSLKNKKKYNATDPINADFSPVFDPSGKYLAFISKRTFNPIYDSLQFDLNFTKSEKPYLIILDKTTPSPFLKDPNQKNSRKSNKKNEKEKKNNKVKVKIDFKGLDKRIVEIPISESSLDNSIGFSGSKLYYSKWPIQGARGDWYSNDNQPKGIVYYYDLDKLEEKQFLSNVSDFSIHNSSDNMIVLSRNNVRIVSLKTVPSKEMLSSPKFNKESGLINLSRIKVNVNLTEEWKQMFSEAWRLQRDYFWVSNMSGINWKKIHNRYYKLINRISTRSEFSDLIWEMQGELGTSHCYEFGGDYKLTRSYSVGQLGATFKYDAKTKSYRIEKIAQGDLWSKGSSPLLRPGLNINIGDYLTKINNIQLTKSISPGELLVNQSGMDIQLTIKKGRSSRNLLVKTLNYDKHLYYRDWVEKNREYVHKKSNGKIGYVHIPDMGPLGFAEFHRYFLAEITYDGLIVDVRFNGGGHVSQILLSKLAKKRIGYDLTRWMGVEPYPSESPAGPMVAITNEYAGSDGDIFSHSWKLMKLGKLIGRRTWGGVIGIWPRNSLVDGTMTSQPEFSFWFKDVGWNVENYGTDVDKEIHITPKDYRDNKDPQLDEGIKIVNKDLKGKDALLKADFSKKPNLKLP